MHASLKPQALSSHPVDVGQRTEAIILAELIRRGHRVLTPSGVNQRYDLVIDLEGKFLRIQCKTGWLRGGLVIFSTRSVRSNTQRTWERGYRGEVDLFLVYCAETGQIYAVPVEEASISYMRLRVDPPLNGQVKGVRWAKDYQLPA